MRPRAEKKEEKSTYGQFCQPHSCRVVMECTLHVQSSRRILPLPCLASYQCAKPFLCFMPRSCLRARISSHPRPITRCGCKCGSTEEFVRVVVAVCCLQQHTYRSLWLTTTLFVVGGQRRRQSADQMGTPPGPERGSLVPAAVAPLSPDPEPARAPVSLNLLVLGNEICLSACRNGLAH